MSVPAAEQAAALLASPDASELWSPLHADGYLVEVQASGPAVTVRVREGEAACADCLVPGAVIRDLALQFLRERGVATDRLALTVDTPSGH